MPLHPSRKDFERLVNLEEVIKRIDENATHEKALARKSETWLDTLCKKYGMVINK